MGRNNSVELFQEDSFCGLSADSNTMFTLPRKLRKQALISVLTISSNINTKLLQCIKNNRVKDRKRTRVDLLMLWTQR